MESRAAYQVTGNPGLDILDELHSIQEAGRFSSNSDISGHDPSRQSQLTESGRNKKNRFYAGRKDIENRASP